MNAFERQAKTLELLRQRGYVSVDDLSHITGVSKMTVRRDLDQLQASNLIERHHGGASLAKQADLEWPWQLRQNIRATQKRLIGQVAASYVQDGDIVMMDGGSTVLEVARNLAQNNLTVVSYCLSVLCELSSRRNIHLIGIGGTLLPDNQTFVGPWTLETLKTMNADIAIMGTSCLSHAKGITNKTIEEAELKRTMIEAATKAVLVADSTKMHTQSLATVGPIEIIDVLVTDSGLASADREKFEAKGVEVVIADGD